MSKPDIKTDTWMPLYVSDYLADTSHLSTEEHGAYILLLMHAWMNNGELPTDDGRLRRICRMDERPWRKSRDEIKAFFYEQDCVLRHRRVDKEIERAQQMVAQRAAAGRASAEKRKAERDAQRNGNESSTTVERDGQRNGKPSPSPSQTPEEETHAIGDSTSPTPAGAASARMRQAGLPDANPGHPKLLALLDEGITPEELEQAAREAVKKGKGFAYALGVAEGRRRDAATVQGLPPAAPEKPWFMSAQLIEEKGKEIGIVRDTDELFPYYRARVYAAAGVTEEMVRKAKIDAGERV